MKKLLIICLSFFFLISLSISAGDFPDYKDKYVNDFANILTGEEVQTLRSAFSEIESNTSAEVVFVSMDSIGSYDISDYTIKLANTWKVGKEDKDNGLVILYVKDINKIFVATGYGLEGILPDSKLGRMLDTYYVPYRNNGNVSLGILVFSYEILNILFENSEEIRSGQTSGNKQIPIFTIIIIFFIIIIFIRIFSSSSSSSRHSGLWWLPLFLPSGRSSGGFGGSFGGGGFGGGGAGR